MDGQSDRSDEPLKSFDFNKRNDRDSIDTLELLKESTETQDEQEDVNSENFQDDKTLTNRSNKSSVGDNIQHQEISQERELSNSIQMSRNSSLSSASIASSMNIENQMNPLPIDSVPFNSKENYTNFNHKENYDDDVETSDLMHLEPKLRDAWIKMRKLDKKLARLGKKEKQVKKETLALIEKNRAELELLKYTSVHKESAVEIANTARFLSLAYCDIDDEMEKDYPIDSEPATPVFKTQLPDIDENESLVDEAEYVDNQKISTKKEKLNSENSPKKFAPNSSVSSNNKSKNQNSNNSSKKNVTSKPKEQANQSGKDFIKRNIQLAQDDAGALAMTDDEKHRLNELMVDMDEFDSNKNRLAINEESEDNEAVVVEYNPFAVTLTQGQGFTPDDAELERLRHIETSLSKRTVSRLTTSNGRISGGFTDSIQKFSSVGSINSSNSNHVIESEFYRGLDAERKQIKLNDEFDENEFGDKFIREARISREKELRLKYIDQQLDKIRNNNVPESNPSQSDNISDFNSETMSNSTVSLISEETIKQLIEDYSYENPKYMPVGKYQKLDTLREENDTDSQNTLSNIEMEAREMENFYNAPILNDNTIKNLLDQAKNEGIFVTANSSREEDSTERSFYQEALEIVNRRKMEFELARQNLEKEQVVPQSHYEENKQKENPEIKNIENDNSSNRTSLSILKKLEDYNIDVDDLNDDLTFKSKMGEDSNLLSKRINSSRSDKFEGDIYGTGESLSMDEFQNDEKSTKLPPLFNKNGEDFTNENTHGNEDGRYSTISNSSTTVLPKINDRYLPREK